ncbi:MAG: MBL fold metallo-hydrolase [Candidatus Hodarchaeota archaeon]
MVQDYLEPITEQIFLVHGENQGRFPRAHAVLINAEKVVLIDTGCGIRRLQAVQKEFAVSSVINSHTHIDHAAGNWVFHGKPILVPAEAFNSAGNLDRLSRRFVSEELAPVWQRFAQLELGFQDCPPTGMYNENTEFRFGDVVLTPVYTPGHTLDHYCLYFAAKRILFTFDYDLTKFPWYGHKESGLAEFRRSIARLEALPTDVVVSAHRGIIRENIRAEWEAFRQRLDDRNHRILALLDSPKTLEQLVQAAPIYRRFPYQEQLLRFWEGIMIQHHLQELEAAGKVSRQKTKIIRVKK